MITATETLSAPELLKFNWNEAGECTDPEELPIFAPKLSAKVGHLILLIAQCPNANWAAGYRVTLKDEIITEAPRFDSSFGMRWMALTNALKAASKSFLKSKPAMAAIEEFFDKLSEELSPAVSRVPASLEPLPKSIPSELSLSSIQTNPENARRDFDEAKLTELCASIERDGLQQPVVVRRLLTDELDELPGVSDAVKAERFELVAGERRLRAFQRLKREKIPCMVFEGVTRAQCKGAGLAENIQREGLNAVEEARGYADLMRSENLTQEQCADRVGKSRPVVANALRILALPDGVIDLLGKGKLTMAHGVALARFKAWPTVVRIIAEEAVKFKAPASDIERGVPYASQLVSAGVIARVHMYELDHEWPAAIKKNDARFIKSDEYNTYCFDPVWWKGIVDAFKQKKADELAEINAKRKAQEEKARKNPQKIKTLDDLPSSAYRIVDKEDQSLLSLVPETAQQEVKGGDRVEGNVTICTKPALFKQIDDAVNLLKKEDREKTLPPLFEQAVAKIAKLKKIGNRDQLLLIYLAQNCEDYCHPCLSDKSSKRLGVKVPKKAVDEQYCDQRLVFTPEAFAALQASTDPLSLYQVLVDDYLHRLFSEGDDTDSGFELPADSDACCLLKWILEVDVLGLLEETKAGQKQMIETVKAADWYKKAIALIEAEETEALAKGKAGK